MKTHMCRPAHRNSCMVSEEPRRPAGCGEERDVATGEESANAEGDIKRGWKEWWIEEVEKEEQEEEEEEEGRRGRHSASLWNH